MARVLIVDDNLLIRVLLREILEYGGHAVAGEATDGIEAVARVGELDPELVILDLVIPRRTGLDTLECLARARPSLPVIICSAGLTGPRVTKALQLGARGFIAKPFDLDTVLDTVKMVTDGSDAAAVLGSVATPSATSGDDGAREERRDFPRSRASLPVVLSPPTGASIKTLTADISGGGMLLTTSPLERDTVVEFALQLDPSEPPVTGRARTVREHAHTQQALAFEQISLADYQRLLRLIRTLQH